jgi:hypothetical protein
LPFAFGGTDGAAGKVLKLLLKRLKLNVAQAKGLAFKINRNNIDNLNIFLAIDIARHYYAFEI